VAIRILIAGVSTRAAAESAAKAGFEVTAIDAFGDLDQHPAVRSLSLPHGVSARFTAQAAAQAVRDTEADAVVYLSPFENHVRAVEALTAGRTLWGNPPEVLRRVRDPFLLAGAIRRRGFATPITRVDVPADLAREKQWLLKPFQSGGGHDVGRWTSGEPVRPGHYVQEYVDGVPASIVFVAASGRAVALGLSRQLIGEPAFGASGFRYCGNLLPSSEDEVLSDRVAERAIALATHVTQEFGLVGVNGIDCVIRDEVPHLIEVNPRWCASMELVERLYGVSILGVHAAACADGTLPSFDLLSARRDRPAIGKAVVFAREDVRVGNTREWLADVNVRDVPKPDEHIAAGQPICTLLAEDDDAERCLVRLANRAVSIVDRCGD
jgi:predicted ATP-grasp superfamily ATP-dependent carboligase